MKKYKYVHLFLINSTLFNRAIQDIICENMSEEEHLFIYKSKNSYEQVKERENCCLDISLNTYTSLVHCYDLAEYVVIHGLVYKNSIISKLSYEKAKRTVWCVWGSDLYKANCKTNIIRNILKKVYNIFTLQPLWEKKANRVISNFNAIAAGFEGDHIEIRKRFGNSVPIYHALYPVGYYINDIEMWKAECLNNKKNKEDKKIKILLGHSAYPFLKHLEYIDKLKEYREDVQLYIPVSYGNKEYAKEVIDKAKKEFGSNALIFEDMMSTKEYFINVLSQVDVAIFDYEHQAAYGNLILLLYLQKKVYLSETGVMYKGFKDASLNIYSVKDLKTNCIKQLSYFEQSNINYEYGIRKLNKINLINDWKRLFERVEENGGNNNE